MNRFGMTLSERQTHRARCPLLAHLFQYQVKVHLAQLVKDMERAVKKSRKEATCRDSRCDAKKKRR